MEEKTYGLRLKNRFDGPNIPLRVKTILRKDAWGDDSREYSLDIDKNDPLWTTPTFQNAERVRTKTGHDMGFARLQPANPFQPEQLEVVEVTIQFKVVGEDHEK